MLFLLFFFANANIVFVVVCEAASVFVEANLVVVVSAFVDAVVVTAHDFFFCNLLFLFLYLFCSFC
jgi:hypothetical protein